MVAMTTTIITLVVFVCALILIESLYSMEAPPGNINCPSCPWSYTPAVPAALQCLTNLTVQYFAMYMAVYLAGLYNMFRNGGQPTAVYRILEDARSTVKFCPMLSVLFIGARLRAIQLETEPQSWAKTAFFIASYCVLGETVVALLQPMVRMYNHRLSLMFEVPRYILIFFLYTSISTVMYSVVMIKQGEHLPGVTPPVSSAMHNIMNMLLQYFGLFLLLTILHTYSHLYVRHTGDSETNIEIMLRAGIPSMDLLPMIMVLFLAARFRGLEVNPDTGELQGWAKGFMWLVNGAALLLTVVCVIIPYFSGQVNVFDERVAAQDRVQKMLMENARLEYKEIAKKLSVLKFVTMFALYAGVYATCASILTLKPTEEVAYA